MGYVFSFIFALGRGTPLFGQLGKVSKAQLLQAFYETSVTAILSSLPIWLMPLLSNFGGRASTLDESILKGEIFIYSAALVAPLIYVITKKYGEFEGKGENSNFSFRLSMIFPYGMGFVLIAFLMCAISTYSITQLRSLDINLLTSENKVSITWWSYVTLAITYILFFLICAYRNMLDDILRTAGKLISNEQRQEENDFSADWQRAKLDD